jgi:hypothetical protein
MFKLIAIRPLKGCGDHIRKCLIEGRMYYFCNDFVITESGIFYKYLLQNLTK